MFHIIRVVIVKSSHGYPLLSVLLPRPPVPLLICSQGGFEFPLMDLVLEGENRLRMGCPRVVTMSLMTQVVKREKISSTDVSR